MKLLVDKGADLSEKDKEGLTALINAAEVSRTNGTLTRMDPIQML